MKILVVENEPFIAEDICGKLKQLGYVNISTTDTVDGALQLINKEKPNVALVDIALNGDKDGIELGKTLHQQNIPFFYLSETQHIETFERAKKTHPQANLVKPVSALQLRNSLLEINSETTETKESSFIVVSHGGKKLKLDVLDIIFLKAARNNCEIHTSERRYLSSSPMNKVINKINSPHFIQVHRSYFINSSLVNYYQGNMIFMKGYDEEIPLSSGFRQSFIDKFDPI